MYILVGTNRWIDLAYGLRDGRTDSSNDAAFRGISVCEARLHWGLIFHRLLIRPSNDSVVLLNSPSPRAGGAMFHFSLERTWAPAALGKDSGTPIECISLAHQ